MRKSIHKLFFIWDFDKEEQWLNEMAAHGLCLVGVGFCKYEFEDCLPGEYRICLQLLEKTPCNPESQKYLEFMEQTGAEHVGSFTRWVYFRKRAAEGSFELFSDNASRIKYLSSILSFIALIVGLNLWIGLQNVLLAIFLKSAFNCFGIVNLVIGIGGSWGIWKLWKKRKRIKSDGQLFE